MPLRNLLTIFFAVVISWACYHQANRNRYASRISQAMNVVTDNYLDRVPYRQLYEDAMRGMTRGLDPYSDYIGPAEFQRFSEGIDQEFGGVGILVEISLETKRLTVVNPLLDTPAFRAGLKSGDTILEIDGRDTENMSLGDAVALMHGKPGAPVRLKILHLGETEPQEVVIKRAVIPVESVLGDVRHPDGTWDFQLADQPRITYLRVVTFGERTVQELEKTLRDRPVEALVLDLRDNAGGLLQAAVDACDLFLDEGEIVSTRGREGREVRSYSAKPGTLIPREVPLVVLVNHLTASASEIVAACLQDSGRAKIVGQRSWGKGTVQEIIPLEGGEAALKLTTASYWRPSGQNIHRAPSAGPEQDWGVRPDDGLEVVLTDEQLDAVRLQRREKDGFRSGKPQAKKPESKPESKPSVSGGDLQLQKAVEYLQQQLSARPGVSGGSAGLRDAA